MTEPHSTGTAPARGTLVAFDGRSGGRDAVALGRSLAALDSAPLTVATVVPFPPATLGELEGRIERPANWDDLCAQLRRFGEQLIADGATPLLEGVEFRRRVVLDDSPARALLTLAASEESAILVAGSSRRGRAGRVFSGSIPTKLLSGGESAVAVAPEGFADRPAGETAGTRIVVAFDARPESERALRGAIELARDRDVELRVHAIVSASSSIEYELTGALLKEAFDVLSGQGLRDRRGAELREAAERALDDGGGDPATEILVEHGDPVELLAGHGPGDCDLLVLGSRGYGPLGRTLLGSTSTKVLQAARVPVLVYPRPG